MIIMGFVVKGVVCENKRKKENIWRVLSVIPGLALIIWVNLSLDYNISHLTKVITEVYNTCKTSHCVLQWQQAFLLKPCSMPHSFAALLSLNPGKIRMIHGHAAMAYVLSYIKPCSPIEMWEAALPDWGYKHRVGKSLIFWPSKSTLHFLLGTKARHT